MKLSWLAHLTMLELILKLENEKKEGDLEREREGKNEILDDETWI